ncbi:sensor histidine kinase [Ottowia sp.]|uniref:sensor histidine kinase n=1 Tax=Ottowia sp. TaxID=1898956 RepID=UPI0039374C2C|nr:histidine kinase [Pseudomonadota bacterium]
MVIDWRDVLRHGLQVLAFCCVVAVFTNMIWPDTGYGQQLVHSAATGMVTWAVMEFGRLLVPRDRCYRGHGNQGHGWPRGWRGVVLTLLGLAAGFLIGRPLGFWLLGRPLEYSQRDAVLSLLVTIAAGVVGSFYFFTRGRQAALQAHIAAAERDASQARLMLLQSQLEPHMLFNTLANLRALIAVDPAAAQRMLDRLDGYLRATLGASRATVHPLADEFARLADYLELMAVRMGPRLRTTLDLPDALRALPVPTLLLQPLVENAIKHGLEPCIDGGGIDVSAARAGDRLTLVVHDSGVGFEPAQAAAAGTHFGLTQVRERLAAAYGARAHCAVESAPGAGTTVTVTLPLDEARP